MKQVLEADILKIAIRLLESRGIRVYRRNTGAITAVHNGKRRFVRFARPGMADLWGILPDGRHVEIEVKRPGNRLHASDGGASSA